MKRVVPALALLAVAASCRVNGLSSYPAAAVFAATAVGATAINRAVTGDCWAVCSVGWHCNHDTGLCDEDQPADTPPAPSTP
jgi:hypothetical protein